MTRLIMSVAVLGMMFGSVVSAADTATECLKSGDAIGAFYVTKVAGAEDDGVENGQELCYRCKYGKRPMVMVFARDTGGKVDQLVKELDSAVGANKEAQLKSFVTLIGEDASALKENAAKFAKASGAKNVPVVVAQDNVTGPTSYKIAKDAAVTIIVANESEVIASHSFDKAEKVDVAAVMGEVKKMLN
ncbi:hypothetical protein NHH03_19150 [Stieleria sp. TO1_6]|uniref:hypothetical protein n=1 Tax=Stieleria tagensis TaxID=2956795 RepID=UPI00209A9E34|nr:hypothetical protein [Stieleria tagensis]MCO8123871.1 hypothetical protein [Stieleria tagensis]